MKIQTVLDLCLACMRLIDDGKGDKKILISDDDEGNGFHSLYCGFTDDTEEIKTIKESCYFADDNNPEDVVLLG